MQRRQFTAISGAIGLLALFCATSANAAPALRTQVTEQGDFVMIGNTLGWDCGVSTNNRIVSGTATVDCATGVTYYSDNAIDIYFQAGESTATASSSVAMEDASSSAVLNLPSATADIVYARLYWSAYQADGGLGDTEVTLDRPGDTTKTETIVARSEDVVTAAVPIGSNGTATGLWYQASAEVTDVVIEFGTGVFRVSGVSAVDALPSLDSPSPMAGWSLIVIYKDPLVDSTYRQITIFDGLDAVGPTQSQSATISGFLVPNSGYTAKLGVLAYEGDATVTGDSLTWTSDGTDYILNNSLNASDNFFNATRSEFGVGVSNTGDVPQVTGAAGSFAGIDMDVVDITSYVTQNQTEATVTASSTIDRYVLGAFVTSIATYQPSFSNSTKTVTDLDDDGLVQPGDTLLYTITVVNSGNDTSTETTLTDVLPSQVAYVEGSLLVDGDETSNSSYTTDTGGNNVLTVYLGDGADPTRGGNMGRDEQIIVTFEVTVNADATGTISNQATITAGGVLGASSTGYVTDGNGLDDGSPTTIGVDECIENSTCSDKDLTKPYCNTVGSPNVCVACLTDTNCSDPTAPNCDDLTNTCVCSAGDGLCGGTGGAGGSTSTTSVGGSTSAATTTSAGGTTAVATTSVGGMSVTDGTVTGGATSAGGATSDGGATDENDSGAAGGDAVGGEGGEGGDDDSATGVDSSLKGSLEGAGCDCAVASNRQSSSGWLLLLGGALFALRRRRQS